MKLHKISLIILIITIITPFIYLSIKTKEHISKVKFVEEPLVYKKFLDNNKVIHELSIQKDSLFPISYYNYKNFSSIILVFKKRTNNTNILDEISFINEFKKEDSNKAYTSGLFKNANYFFNKNEDINSIKLFIENFKRNQILVKRNDFLHISLKENKTFAIAYNNENGIGFQSTQKTKSINEKSELIITLKDNQLFFFYSKSNNGKSSSLRECLNLIV